MKATVIFYSNRCNTRRVKESDSNTERNKTRERERKREREREREREYLVVAPLCPEVVTI